MKGFLLQTGRFFRRKRNRRLCYLLLLSLWALREYVSSGLVRRSFVFYAYSDGAAEVEDRMLMRSGSREIDIRRYVDEVCLGPVSPDAAPLFTKETRLRSLLFRDGVVYADLTESAALPPPEGGVFRGMLTLDEGIRRNFSFVQDVRLFINGREAYRDDLERIFPHEKVLFSKEK